MKGDKNMKKKNITEIEVLNFFLNISFNTMYNRCYIHKACNNCYYLQFENDIQLDVLIGYFKAYCKQINKDWDNISIEHREFVRGHLITNTDYVLCFSLDSEFFKI